MSNIIQGAFPGEGSGGSADGGGPEGPMLEARVEVLEKRMDRFEQKLDRIDETLQSLKIALIELSANCATKSDISELKNDVAKIREELAENKGRITGLSDRFAYIPSTWQMITFMLGSQIAFAGILFTALKFGLK
jgi:predicted RNase H-like nuclease (RuvC/YqgF family)